jgi:hypothetical protein
MGQGGFLHTGGADMLLFVGCYDLFGPPMTLQSTASSPSLEPKTDKSIPVSAHSDAISSTYDQHLPKHSKYVLISSIITAALAAIAFYLIFWSNLTSERLSAIGTIISGFAAVIAFIWFIQGFLYQYRSILLQNDGLRAQLKELALHRQALTDTSTATNTNLFIVIFDHYIHSLNRFCRSLVILCSPESKTEIDSAYPFSLIRVIETEPEAVFENPATKSLLDEYIDQYRYIRALAAQFGCSELFEYLMKNSPHKQICSLADNYVTDQTL